MCYFRVVDAQTKRVRKCRCPNVLTRPSFAVFVCWVHSWDPAAKIQAAWRQFKTRKTVGVFKTLPSDLWGEVLRHIERRNKVPDLIRSHRKIYETRYNWTRGNWILIQRASVDFRQDIDTLREYQKLMERVATASYLAKVNLEWCNYLLSREVMCV